MATHNAVLINASSLLVAARRQPVWGGLKKRTFDAQRHDEHDQIVAAAKERDAEAAREAMKGHLRHVRRTLLGDAE
ncbi:FCD domain-containing protein [Streptomyces canus]|uniref:FCD domain-containing protein n=1 Tax=Streptomyces canus TaxID=58343 RepID=UPI00380F3199